MKRLSAILICLLLPALSIADITSNLEVFYRMENNLTDSSGNSRTGVWGGTALFGAGKIGLYAGDFTNNAPFNHIIVPAIGTKTAFTLCAWVRPHTFNPSWFDVVYASDGFSAGAVHIQFLATGALAFTIAGQADLSFGSATNFPLDTWTYLVVTYDSANGQVKCYANGSQVGSTQTYATGVSATFIQGAVGCWSGDLTRSFDGRIDDFRIFSRVLSASDITEAWKYIGYVGTRSRTVNGGGVGRFSRGSMVNQ